MPTKIVFTASRGDKPLGIRVKEEPGEVLERLAAEQDRPFALELASNGERVYVNPAAVAYWQEA